MWHVKFNCVQKVSVYADAVWQRKNGSLGYIGLIVIVGRKNIKESNSGSIYLIIAVFTGKPRVCWHIYGVNTRGIVVISEISSEGNAFFFSLVFIDYSCVKNAALVDETGHRQTCAF